MAETSFVWGGTVLGDASLAPYDDDEWTDLWNAGFVFDGATEGVIRGKDNELAVTNPAGTTLTVDTGYAWVDGKVYKNDASLNLTGVGVATWGIVFLRKDFASQTVRAGISNGFASEALALASLTQSAVFWDIPLAIFQMDGLGTGLQALLDYRAFVPPSGVEHILREYTVPAGGVTTFYWDNIPQTYNDLIIEGFLACIPPYLSNHVEMRMNQQAGPYTYEYGGLAGLGGWGFFQVAIANALGICEINSGNGPAWFKCTIPYYRGGWPGTNPDINQYYSESSSQQVGAARTITWYSGHLNNSLIKPITRLDFYADFANMDTFEPGSVFKLYGRT